VTRSSGIGLLSRFRVPVALLLVALLYGTVGYRLMEGWTLLDALYMTVTTLTTVGFREIHPLGPGGEVFTISLILLGLGAVFATIGVGTELVVSGELGAWYRRRQVDRQTAGLREHHVICAYGRVGRAVAASLSEQGAPFCVVDNDPSLIPLMESHGVIHLTGDPSDEEVLREVGIEHARGLVSAVDSDAVNVFITLTARALNPELSIVARASRAESVDRLLRAGADRVVSPYELSGRRMAFLATRPAVVDFLEMVALAPELTLEEILVRPGSALDGRSVGEAVADHPGVTVLAVKRGEDDLQASPGADTRLASGDLVLVMGPQRALEALLA
jgi:voltage-gated potassium channel